jgi:DNA-binding transcriptional LysR family regulator
MGIFTAGMAEYAEVALAGRLAKTFAGQATQATLRLTPMTGAEAAERLDSGAIDVAVAHLRGLPGHLESIILLRDPFVLVARRDHPRARPLLSLAAYAALDHVLVSPRGDTSGAVDRALADFGLKRRIALLVATYLALPAVLAASDFVATVPRRTAQQIAAVGEIDIMPLAIDLAVSVSMAWHRRVASEPAQIWLRSLLIEAAKD